MKRQSSPRQTQPGDTSLTIASGKFPIFLDQVFFGYTSNITFKDQASDGLAGSGLIHRHIIQRHFA